MTCNFEHGLTFTMPCNCHTVPLISVAGEFVDIPEPGQVGAYNVGLVTLPEEESQVAEFKALFISAKLLQQV